MYKNFKQTFYGLIFFSYNYIPENILYTFLCSFSGTSIISIKIMYYVYIINLYGVTQLYSEFFV